MSTVDIPLTLQREFALEHQLTYQCNTNSQHIFPYSHQYLVPELQVTGDDLKACQADPKKPFRLGPPLSAYLSTALPRSIQDRNQALPLTNEAIECQVAGCGGNAVIFTIATQWPLFLQVYPHWSHRGLHEADVDVKDVQATLHLVFGDGVHYTLAGRVLYHHKSGDISAKIGANHFSAQVYVDGTGYRYDDCMNDGQLKELTSLGSLFSHHPDTHFFLYIRMLENHETIKSRNKLNRSLTLIPPAPAVIPVIYVDSDSEQPNKLQATPPRAHALTPAEMSPASCEIWKMEAEISDLQHRLNAARLKKNSDVARLELEPRHGPVFPMLTSRARRDSNESPGHNLVQDMQPCLHESRMKTSTNMKADAVTAQHTRTSDQLPQPPATTKDLVKPRAKSIQNYSKT
ncbi:hypothetical protein JAAARDRAFT_188784 [Jaapia argillacea MUCL 33604]|uniref:Uncharacterized protein n=1 Tax=Jaapia argillacea MUCL 33604 TaxID=933084 RepID=A0A067Q803_9AGAM|nr:hypothetical protein JAAARDRAFT_188784 [Jaapia argillacea MUCL 33604]